MILSIEQSRMITNKNIGTAGKNKGDKMSVTHSHLKLLKKLKVAALSVQSQIIKRFTGVSKRIIVTSPCQIVK